jgi:putative oxidoreductase
MKVTATIARYLMGLIFTVFGLNGFLHFIPVQPMPPLAMQFFGAVVASHFMAPIFALQLIAGLLLLVNRFVPLALTVLAGIIFNILVFHITMAPAGLAPGVVVTLLWIIVAQRHRSAFAPLFAAGPRQSRELSAAPLRHAA